MLIYLYLLIVISAIYWVVKTLAPEFAKPPMPRPLTKNKISATVINQDSTDARIEKLESLISEKNINIQLLQKELRVFHVKVREFDKIKDLLDGEIRRLREQNRIFRSELGLPTVPTKERTIN